MNKVPNIYKILNKKCVAAMEEITHGTSVLQQGKIFQYLPLTVIKSEKQNWYIDKFRIHNQNPELFRFDWFIRQYLLATTETTLLKCLELLYRRANMEKYKKDMIIEGQDKEIFIKAENVSANQILKNKYLKSPYTTKVLLIKNLKQLDIDNLKDYKEEQFMEYLQKYNIKIVTFDKLENDVIMEYIMNKKKYNKIFIEDNVFQQELVQDNFPEFYKPDVIFVGYQVIDPEQLSLNSDKNEYNIKLEQKIKHDYNLGKEFPNASVLMQKQYSQSCAKMAINEQFLTFFKRPQKEKKTFQEHAEQDSYLKFTINQAAKVRVQKAQRDFEKKRRQEYKEQNNI
ncbi:hypothetical protein PPERSA_05909 [Pseudocohnilembus persalinus]|uniref:Uncharacterized protein n=1 Tax=Pseudocohnilembus persalinus TaxID=266149 RepID=A0A0V0R4U9_PSEPJ|nr:hypothetical protein PPERSA_05909 [Pseudocohnilembus persalinus]|eukprot:KRX09240.1 hypothetical protein PPERSA_05909 [Pseudocohnilembus persalinus]